MPISNRNENFAPGFCNANHFAQRILTAFAAEKLNDTLAKNKVELIISKRYIEGTSFAKNKIVKFERAF